MEDLETNDTSLGIERSSDATGDPVIALTGELDISNAETFRRVVDEIIGQKPTRLSFDLSALTFMDSSGIAVMVHAANNVEAIELHHASAIIQRVVEATGLKDVLRVDPS
jgi:anti-sigma B factor antagonist